MVRSRKPKPIAESNWPHLIAHTSNADYSKVSLHDQARRMLRDSIYSAVCGAMLSTGIPPHKHVDLLRVLASAASTQLADSLVAYPKESKFTDDAGRYSTLKIGDKVTIKHNYPLNRKNIEREDAYFHGKPGTVVEGDGNGNGGFIAVLLDDEASNPQGWGFFYQAELELTT